MKFRTFPMLIVQFCYLVDNCFIREPGSLTLLDSFWVASLVFHEVEHIQHREVDSTGVNQLGGAEECILVGHEYSSGRWWGGNPVERFGARTSPLWEKCFKPQRRDASGVSALRLYPKPETPGRRAALRMADTRSNGRLALAAVVCGLVAPRCARKVNHARSMQSRRVLSSTQSIRHSTGESTHTLELSTNCDF